MSKTKFALVLVVLLVVSANVKASGQSMYPVSGPLSQQKSPPVFVGNPRHPHFTSWPADAKVKTWALSNGEVATGKTAIVKITSLNLNVSSVAAGYPPQPNLAFVWDGVYGTGFSVVHLLGNSIFQGVYKGNQGTVLQVELLGTGVGVAVDNHGNTYKIVNE